MRENEQKEFKQADKRLNSTIKLFEQTSIFRALLKIVFLAVLASLTTGIYTFVDQILMTQLIPNNSSFTPEIIFGQFNGQDLFSQMNRIVAENNLPISTSVSSVIRTAISVSSVFVIFSTAIALFFGLGISVSYSKQLGKHNILEMKKVWTNGFYSMLIGVVVSSAIMIGIADVAIPFQTGGTAVAINEQTIPNAMDRIIAEEFLLRARNISISFAKNYIFILIGFNVLNTATVLFSTLLNSEGKNLIVTVIIIGANLINIVADVILLVFTPLGMIGAALATVMSWLISVLGMVVYVEILNKKNETFLNFVDLKKVRWSKNILWAIVAIGSASFFRSAGASLFVFFQQSIFSEITPLTSNLDANYYLGISGAIQPIYALFFSALIGVIRGARTVLSYNHAKNNFVKVKQTYWISLGMALGYAFAFFIFVNFIIPNQLLSLFNITNETPQLLIDAKELLIITMSQLPLFCLGIAGMLFFQSTGKNFWSLMSAIAPGIIFGIPVLFIFKSISLSYSNIEIFLFTPIIALGLASIITFIFSTYYIYKIEPKIHKKISEKLSEANAIH